jgi:FHS family L-fucose permease-like MFS transporter
MATISSPAPTAVSEKTNGQTYRGPFAIMTVLFFLWGFITVLNDILIPRLQDAFSLSNYQIMFVQTAFFGAYFIGGLLYFLISTTAGDPIARIGYKNGVALGLLLAALGSAMFWPAATLPSYPLFLGGLFVVGLGLTLLQIAANPYVTILGPERTASSRLNLAQGFNSVGTTIGPLIGGYLIFQYFAESGANGAASVRIPYLAFCIVFTILALIFFFLHLPHVGEGKIEPGVGALKYPHVLLGVVAIFMYVGGEVSVGSNIIKFLGEKSVAGLTPLEASKYVSLFWGGMLLGRFMGSVELSEMKPAKKKKIFLGITALGLQVVWVPPSLKNHKQKIKF